MKWQKGDIMFYFMVELIGTRTKLCPQKSRMKQKDNGGLVKAMVKTRLDGPISTTTSLYKHC
jgi:hypothetical protein